MTKKISAILGTAWLIQFIVCIAIGFETDHLLGLIIYRLIFIFCFVIFIIVIACTLAPDDISEDPRTDTPKLLPKIIFYYSPVSMAFDYFINLFFHKPSNNTKTDDNSQNHIDKVK